LQEYYRDRAPLNAAIALSILFLGPEIVRVWRGETSLTIRKPWLVAFCFGLLHGFGFASALSSTGLPRADLPLALLTFNVGEFYAGMMHPLTSLEHLLPTLVLLLAAVLLNRVGFGIALVLAFSVGLAAVLTAVGLLFVKGSRLLQRVPQAGIWMRVLPAVSALVILVIGIGLTAQAVMKIR
jgi:hypothetical protein